MHRGSCPGSLWRVRGCSVLGSGSAQLVVELEAAGVELLLVPVDELEEESDDELEEPEAGRLEEEPLRLSVR